MLPMRITLNAQAIDLSAPISLAQLIERQGLARAACATEVNKTLIKKNQRTNTMLNEGDKIEIVSLVGGG